MFHQRAEIAVEFSEHLFPYSMYFFNNRVVYHGRTSGSSKGVQMIGGA